MTDDDKKKIPLTEIDKRNVLSLRESTGCPLSTVMNLYKLNKTSPESTVDLDVVTQELLRARKGFFEKIINNHSKELKNDIVFIKESEGLIEIVTIKTQTDFLPREQLMKDFVRCVFEDREKAKSFHEYLVVYANERFIYEYRTIEYTGLAKVEKMAGQWANIVMDGISIGEKGMVLVYKNEITNSVNIIKSKLIKYLDNLDLNKLKLNEEILLKILTHDPTTLNVQETQIRERLTDNLIKSIIGEAAAHPSSPQEKYDALMQKFFGGHPGAFSEEERISTIKSRILGENLNPPHVHITFNDEAKAAIFGASMASHYDAIGVTEYHLINMNIPYVIIGK